MVVFLVFKKIYIGLVPTNSKPLKDKIKGESRNIVASRSFVNIPKNIHHKNDQKCIKTSQMKNNFIRLSYTPRYENIFLGNFYSCNIFGHKKIHCKFNTRYYYVRSMNDYGFRLEMSMDLPTKTIVYLNH